MTVPSLVICYKSATKFRDGEHWNGQPQPREIAVTGYQRRYPCADRQANEHLVAPIAADIQQQWVMLGQTSGLRERQVISQQRFPFVRSKGEFRICEHAKQLGNCLSANHWRQHPVCPCSPKPGQAVPEHCGRDHHVGVEHRAQTSVQCQLRLRAQATAAVTSS